MKVCHFTSAHKSDDIRIFVKECSSLASAGFDVYLVAQGVDREENGVHVIGVGKMPENRKNRMTKFVKKIYFKALEIDADIYHFHDPELLPYGLKLKKMGKRVIFDSHEDVPAQILDKTWIPLLLRRIISEVYKIYETFVVRKLDVVITATEHIASAFENRAKKILVINNYPKLDDIVFHNTSFLERAMQICYAGGLNNIRGQRVMVEATMNTDAKLVIAGPCDDDYIQTTKGNFTYLGLISREQVNELYGNSRMGILLYQPAKNHFESQPIKMFEYMAAGLPFVASDFPLWKNIAEGNRCGLCVDPRNKEAVKEACNFIIRNPQKAEEMKKNGRKAVLEKYNWAIEEKKLKTLYMQMEGNLK